MEKTKYCSIRLPKLVAVRVCGKQNKITWLANHNTCRNHDILLAVSIAYGGNKFNNSKIIPPYIYGVAIIMMVTIQLILTATRLE
jgi:hypothetical protein